MPRLALAQHPESDALLSNDPLALLIGMVLDQQIPLEKAFRSPYELKLRLNAGLDAAEIAAYDPDKLIAMFTEPPALHRFPGSMAKRVQELCRIIAEEYDNQPAQIWENATTGAELVRSVEALPGFGKQKARIFVALLGKQFGVQPDGWQAASTPYGDDGTLLSVADITDEQTLAQVREHKRQMKAEAKANANAAATATKRSSEEA